MIVWVVSSVTESGDDYTYVWLREPSYDDILAAIQRDMPDEFGVSEDDDTHNAPDQATQINTED